MPTAVSNSARKGKGKGRAVPEKVSPAMPLGKQLAHTGMSLRPPRDIADARPSDKAVRDRAVEGLVAFLSRGAYVDEESGESSWGYTPLSESEMAKLWKGLFYCFWMSDKPLVQQRLATDLAELLLLINPTSGASAEIREEDRLLAALGFLEGFWKAIVREWTGLDRLRMDKFYMLMRRYVNATFRLLARHGWSQEAVEGVNRILTAKSGPVTWEDKSVPSSISTHLADIYLDELDKVLSLPEVNSQPACPITFVLQPHIILLARTPTQTVYTRIMSSLFTPLLNALSLASPSTDNDRPAKRARTDEPVHAHIVMGCCLGNIGVEARATPAQLHKGLLQALFNAAAQEGANESSRRKIYQVWREQGGGEDDDDE